MNKDIYRVNDSGKDKKIYSTKSRNDILQQFKEFLFFAIDNFDVDRSVVKNVKRFKKTHEEKLKSREKEENMWSI